MYKFTVSAIFAGCLLLLSPINFAKQDSNLSPDAVELALQAAEKARQQANAVKYEWRDTAKILKKAQAALDKNNLAKAMQLAELAKLQSEQAIEQAEREKNAGPRF